MKYHLWKKRAGICALIFIFAMSVACGGDDGDYDEVITSGDAGPPCEGGADLYVKSFSVGNIQAVGGPLNVDSIRICNNGDKSSSSFIYDIQLTDGPSIYGKLYEAAESDYNAGIAPGKCSDYWTSTTVPNVPDGFYYVIVRVDPTRIVAECNENNNQTVSGTTYLIGN
jgi:hypothetical protein